MSLCLLQNPRQAEFACVNSALPGLTPFPGGAQRALTSNRFLCVLHNNSLFIVDGQAADV